jgi:RNA polymerase sigma-70 factor, ECF subfamily
MEPPAAARAIRGMDDRTPATDDDAATIARSLDDPAAFERVFERHLAAVHAFVERRVGRDLAEEVTAETFARAFAARRRYDQAHRNARPWLLGIASNLLRRHWRTERRRLAAYARSLRAERPAEQGDRSGVVVAAVARLPRRQREVLLLHAWADLGYAEIAAALGVPVGTVRSRLARARAALAAEAASALDPPRIDAATELSHV